MKKTYLFLTKLVFLGTLLTVVSCSEDDPTIDNGQVDVLPSSIQLDDFETDEGEIAVSFSARSIAQKGYMPALAEIAFNEVEMATMEVPFDVYNNIATVSFKNGELDDDLEAQLKEGIGVEVNVLDETGNVLSSKKYSKLSFSPSPTEQELPSENLDDKLIRVSLREDVYHYMQIVTPGNKVYGVPSSKYYPSTSNLAAEVTPVEIDQVDYNSDDTRKFSAYVFTKVPGEENLYTITIYDGSDRHNLYMLQNTLRVQTKANIERNGGNTDPLKFQNYWFRIIKKAPGLYQIIPYLSEMPLAMAGSGFKSEQGEEIYFRILALDIDWEIQAVDAKFMRPIMPPSSTSSAYNSTLRNCSSGSLSQTVGESTTITTIQTAAWSETMSVATTEEGSVSLTLSTEAETKFFGNGGKTSASVTGTYTYSKTQTQTNTRSQALATEKSVQVSVSREVVVPAGTAISVADIYQSVSKCKGTLRPTLQDQWFVPGNQLGPEQ